MSKIRGLRFTKDSIEIKIGDHEWATLDLKFLELVMKILKLESSEAQLPQSDAQSLLLLSSSSPISGN